MKKNITEKDINKLNDVLIQSSLDSQDEEEDCFMIDGKSITKLITLVTQYDYIMDLLESINDDYLYQNHLTLWQELKKYKGE